MRGSNINLPWVQRISSDWCNYMLTSPIWVLVLSIGYRGVDTIEYWQTDGIVRTLLNNAIMVWCWGLGIRCFKPAAYLLSTLQWHLSWQWPCNWIFSWVTLLEAGLHGAVHIQTVSATLAVSSPASSLSKCQLWLQHPSVLIVYVALTARSL
jgi:hypothetical protein